MPPQFHILIERQDRQSFPTHNVYSQQTIQRLITDFSDLPDCRPKHPATGRHSSDLHSQQVRGDLRDRGNLFCVFMRVGIRQKTDIGHGKTRTVKTELRTVPTLLFALPAALQQGRPRPRRLPHSRQVLSGDHARRVRDVPLAPLAPGGGRVLPLAGRVRRGGRPCGRLVADAGETHRL